ncbi:MAG TPA: hypothetical protein VFI48_06035 [Hyphomicrobiaceae bacterium]|nr:hypothetical protein [Hyphomicrobiaceae bacterium]
MTWAQAIGRDSGEAQLEIIGKSSKALQVLKPAVIAAHLFESRGEAPVSAPVFQSVRRPSSQLTERAINFIVKEAAERAGVNPTASIHWLRHAARRLRSRRRLEACHQLRRGDEVSRSRVPPVKTRQIG